MNWKDTVLKSTEMKFYLKVKDDASLDLTIPIQKLAELQAKRAFASGVLEGMVFLGAAQADGKPINNDLITAQCKKWGIEDLWEQAQKAQENKSHD